MPGVNHAALSVGIIAVSVVVAAGIAIYESPELRRIAEDLRRRIAVALHSLGDSISPQERENLLNRPEDAEGFLLSRGINVRGEQDVDADEESRRRQREELMYWNAIADEKRQRERRNSQKSGEARRSSSRGSNFDDFLRQDSTGEKGTFVYHTGVDVRGDSGIHGLRHRGEGLRGLNSSVYTNPFADEHGIDEHVAVENSLMDPDKDEVESDIDIYNASQDNRRDYTDRTSDTLSALPENISESDPLVDLNDAAGHETSTSTAEPELGPDDYMTAGQEDRQDAFSSIQAWAETSAANFYSPLPESPAGPLSEPELVSDGEMTPTDSASLAGSGEDIAEEARSTSSQEQHRYYDVMSDDEGMATPTSWTEVGSVVSESDAGAQHAQPAQPAHA